MSIQILISNQNESSTVPVETTGPEGHPIRLPRPNPITALGLDRFRDAPQCEQDRDACHTCGMDPDLYGHQFLTYWSQIATVEITPGDEQLEPSDIRRASCGGDLRS